MSLYKKVISIPTDELIQLINKHESLSSLVKSFGFNGQDSRVRKYIRGFIKTHKLIDCFKSRGNEKGYTDIDVINATKSSYCYSDVLTKIGLSPYGGNIRTIKKCIRRLNLDVSHFDRVISLRKNKKTYTKEQIFCIESKYPRTGLKQAVIKYKVLSYECALCYNQGVWNNTKLTLSLDHINGINNDNRVENLRFLCPNCHSQTDTYAGKNRKGCLSSAGRATDLSEAKTLNG